MSQAPILSKRIFIGGLSDNVSEKELSERFSRFGKVSNVSLKTRKDDDGTPLKSFAHLNLEGDESSIKRCFNTYQNAKWKGSVMKLQYAKESILERLQREREENVSTTAESPKQIVEKPPPPEIPTIAKGVPGTPVPGKKDWVVGKYGRALPVLKLKKSYKIPMVKHDPSKFCHAAKVFKDDQQEMTLDEDSFSKLTWEINDADSAITKKRKGEFPENPASKKKKPAPSGAGLSLSIGSNKVSSSSDIPHNNQKLWSSMPIESNDLEVVKIGTVIGKPRSADIRNISNKFDSDLESDPESSPKVFFKQSNRKPDLPKKPKTSDTKVNTKAFTDKSLDRLSNGGETVSHSLPNKLPQTRDDEESFNTAGIPEFKGLSMLAVLDKSSTVSTKSDSMVSSIETPQPVTNNSKLKSKKTVSSNGFITTTKTDQSNASSGLSDANKTSTSHALSFRENSVIAQRAEHSTIATPAPFAIKQEHDSFKTSTPNAPLPVGFSKPDPTPACNGESQSHRRLGVLADYSVVKKNLSLESQTEKEKDEDTESGEEDSLSVNSSSLVKKAKHKKGERSPKQKVKAVVFQSNATDPALSAKKNVVDGIQQSKSASSPQDHDINFDSDSSAGTDEIILRHKERTFSDNSLQSKPKRFDEQSMLANKPSKVKVSSDKNLLMSEVFSGLDEFDGEAQRSNFAATSRKDSDNDSYDSDLDSNDFALVAKKLRQQAMPSKHGLREKMHSDKNKKKKDPSAQKDKTVSNTKETKVVEEKKVTELQNKLINIAGLEKEPVKSSRTPDCHSESHKKQVPLSEQEKHKAANDKRLEAVKLQAKQRQQHQQLMQQALKNVDSLEGNKKRIVFESSDDDDDDRGDEDHTNKSKTDNSTASKILSTEKIPKQEKSGPALFASSDEDESDEDDYDEMFKSKPQFEGKKGEKLLKLETRIGDKRFKMDARFADTDSEEEEQEDDMDNNKSQSADAASKGIAVDDSDLSDRLKAEKNSSLKVLENIVGKSTLDRFAQKISRNTKKIIDMNSVRFDPTKMPLQSLTSTATQGKKSAACSTVNTKLQTKEVADSVKPMKKENKISEVGVGKAGDSSSTSKVDSCEDVNNNQAKKENKKSKKNVSKTDESGGKSKTNVELSSSLLNLFKTQAEEKTEDDTSFSFAQQFGDGGSDKEEEENDDKGEDKETLKVKEVADVTKNKATAHTPVLVDEEMNSDSDQEGKEQSEKQAEDTTKMSLLVDSVFSSDEEEMREDGNPEIPNLSCGEKSKTGMGENLQEAGRVDVRFTKEQWHEGWDTLRQSIIKIYKKKHKDALKKKRIIGETKRKRDFLKNSKKVGGGKRTSGFSKKR